MYYFSINLAENSYDAKFIIPRLTLIGNYDVTGQVLGMFPLVGQGVVNFTLCELKKYFYYI